MAKKEDNEGFFDGFFANVFGGGEETSPDKSRVVNAITSPTGWDLTLEMGSQIAKKLGGNGEVRLSTGMRSLCVQARIVIQALFHWQQTFLTLTLPAVQQVAKGDVMNFKVGVSVRLELDEGYDPPQGSVFIVSDSTIFKGEGFWSILEDTDEGVPTAIQVSCFQTHVMPCSCSTESSSYLAHVVPHSVFFPTA